MSGQAPTHKHPEKEKLIEEAKETIIIKGSSIPHLVSKVETPDHILVVNALGNLQKITEKFESGKEYPSTRLATIMLKESLKETNLPA